MGVAVGARRLVATARRFGFDQPPDVPGVATSTIPAAAEIGDDLALGSTAIGQGRVQATTLQMAAIAATVGLRGRRPAPHPRRRRGADRGPDDDRHQPRAPPGPSSASCAPS